MTNIPENGEGVEEIYRKIEEEHIKEERSKLLPMSDEVRGFAILSGKSIARTLRNKMVELDEDRVAFMKQFTLIRIFYEDYRGVRVVDEENIPRDPLAEIDEINKKHSDLSGMRDKILQRVEILDDRSGR